MLRFLFVYGVLVDFPFDVEGFGSSLPPFFSASFLAASFSLPRFESKRLWMMSEILVLVLLQSSPHLFEVGSAFFRSCQLSLNLRLDLTLFQSSSFPFF